MGDIKVTDKNSQVNKSVGSASNSDFHSGRAVRVAKPSPASRSVPSAGALPLLPLLLLPRSLKAVDLFRK